MTYEEKLAAMTEAFQNCDYWMDDGAKIRAAAEAIGLREMMAAQNRAARFAVFAYDSYYPGGGIGDMQGCAPTIEAARELAKKHMDYDYVVIVDTNTMEEVEDMKWPPAPAS
jgi:putative aminopeptidase FrvX